jgi:hypothetical protein
MRDIEAGIERDPIMDVCEACERPLHPTLGTRYCDQHRAFEDREEGTARLRTDQPSEGRCRAA